MQRSLPQNVPQHPQIEISVQLKWLLAPEVSEELLGDLEVSGYYIDVDKYSYLLKCASVDWYTI
jgi:hypothetical protein